MEKEQSKVTKKQPLSLRVQLTPNSVIKMNSEQLTLVLIQKGILQYKQFLTEQEYAKKYEFYQNQK